MPKQNEFGQPQRGGGEDGNPEGDRGRQDHPHQEPNVNRPPHDRPVDREKVVEQVKPGEQNDDRAANDGTDRTKGEANR